MDQQSGAKDKCCMADTYSKTLEDHEKRIVMLENMSEQLMEISNIATKVLKHVRIWGPAIVAAAASSGIVSGKWGAFLHALFN